MATWQWEKSGLQSFAHFKGVTFPVTQTSNWGNIGSTFMPHEYQACEQLLEQLGMEKPASDGYHGGDGDWQEDRGGGQACGGMGGSEDKAFSEEVETKAKLVLE